MDENKLFLNDDLCPDDDCVELSLDDTSPEELDQLWDDADDEFWEMFGLSADAPHISLFPDSEEALMEVYNYGPDVEDGLCKITDATGLYDLLSGLDYKSMTCDGLPGYKLSFDSKDTFLLNISDKWVWRGKEEAQLSDEEMSILMSCVDISD